MAASRTFADTLWALNDGGNAASLYAIGNRGGLQATLRIDSVPNTDWEDLAAFDLDGRHYLLIADTGDNGGLRKTLQLHVVEEPRDAGRRASASRRGRSRSAGPTARATAKRSRSMRRAARSC